MCHVGSLLHFLVADLYGIVEAAKVGDDRDAKGADATVTVCHSRTRDIASFTRSADLIVSAIGKPEFLRGDMVKEGVVVIDVGINRVAAPGTEKGYKLVGDVAFDEVAPKASRITPVPGGVGPMTIAMLMKNTVRAFHASFKN